MDAYDSSFHLLVHFLLPRSWLHLRAKRTWGKYSTFRDSFHAEVKQLLRRLERIKNRKGCHEVSVLFNQTHTHTHTHTHIYIYIYMYIYIICMYIYLYMKNLEFCKRFQIWYLCFIIIIPYLYILF